jgi:hypothetical protein
MQFVLLIVALLLIVPAVYLFYARRRFERRVAAEVEAMFSHLPPADGAVFTYDMLEGLPDPVQRYFRRNVPEGTPLMQTCRLQHGGSFRTSPDAKWLPVEAEQYFTADPPQFIWQVRMQMLPGLWIDGRDKLLAGHGNMLIKPLSAITVVDDRGPALDQGSLMRYMAEVMWFPTALLPDQYRRWEAIDANTARLHMTLGETTAWIDYIFDEAGDILRNEGPRWRGNDTAADKERWGGTVTAWGEFEGVRLPVQMDVAWYLDEGEFAYVRWELTKVEFNKRAKF